MKFKKFNHLDVYTFQRSKEGKSCCGDSFYIYETDEYFIGAIADGLGSGIEAHRSSTAAISMVRNYHNESVSSIMERCNRVLRMKRGAVLVIFKINYKTREVEYSSIGNIRFLFAPSDDNVVNLMPTSGFLSGRPQPVQVKKITVSSGSKFFVFTDGLKVASPKKFLSNFKSIFDASSRLKASVSHPEDDVTFLMGKLNI